MLRNALVTDQKSSYNGQQLDLRIREGKIVAIGEALKAEDQEAVVDLKGARVSPGFIDIGPYLGEPGREEREDLISLSLAAARGGYTAVAPLPDAKPARHDKSGIAYLRDQARELPVSILPLGAVSQNLAGQDITEMMDMRAAGAVAFTDAPRSIASAGLMSRALHYVKTFGGIVINCPLDASLAPHGQLHEGPVSTRMGLPGIPPISEQLMLHRDLELLEYADSKLLVHLVSCERSLELLAAAKRKGLGVNASVAALNLQFTSAVMEDFDSAFKVIPPLREASDQAALIGGLLDGTIDCVVSNHIGHDEEHKELEFTYAAFGSPALQSCFAQSCTALGAAVAPDQLAAFFSHGPRRALGLPPLQLEIGAIAELSFFNVDESWGFQPHPATEKGGRNGLNGKRLVGRPIATYHNGRLRYCTE